jgi:hypothetical protein
LFPFDLGVSLSYIVLYINRRKGKMEYIMQDQLKSNERYRRRKSWEKLYMWIATGSVIAFALSGIML